MDAQGYGEGVTAQILEQGLARLPTASASSMAFPSNLGSYPFWMTFSFYQYKRPKFTGNPVLQNKNTIRLPLPNQLVDHQDVVYNPEEAGLVAGTAINQFQETGSFTQAAAIGAAGAAFGLNRLGGKLPGLIGQLGGVAINPFLTVMFKSPAFKVHQLTWRLSPTNVGESQILNNIISTLRYNQLPDKAAASGGTLLTYPNIVQVSVSNPQSFLYKFKPAVIESLSFNFAPGGQPSFFNNAAPTEVEIRVKLLEIEYYLQSDFGPGSTAGLNLVSNALNAWNARIEELNRSSPNVVETPSGPRPSDANGNLY